MNAQRKKSAVTKYTPQKEQGLTPEELTNLLTQDEKGYTTDEINEIVEAIFNSPGTGEAAPGKKATTGSHHEEWRCEIKLTTQDGKVTGRAAEKVKMLRPCVKISDEEADTLNHGALHSPRQDYVLMYFKPE